MCSIERATGFPSIIISPYPQNKIDTQLAEFEVASNDECIDECNRNASLVQKKFPTLLSLNFYDGRWLVGC